MNYLIQDMTFNLMPNLISDMIPDLMPDLRINFIINLTYWNLLNCCHNFSIDFWLDSLNGTIPEKYLTRPLT